MTDFYEELNEYIFYPFDVEGVHDETEELHVDVDSQLGQFISEDKP